MATARDGLSGPLAFSTARQVGAVDQAHLQIQLPVDLAIVVDRHHVRFGQPPRRIGLTSASGRETSDRRRIAARSA